MICKTVSSSAVWLDAAVIIDCVIQCSTALNKRAQAKGVGALLVICRQKTTAERKSRETSCALATLSSMLQLQAGAEQSDGSAISSACCCLKKFYAA